MSYYPGSLVRLLAPITDLNGNPADPTNLTILVLAPDGTSTSFTYPTDAVVVRDSLGNYHYDLTVTQVGVWLYEWTASGTIVAVQPGEVTVLAFPTGFPPWSYSGDPSFSVKDEIRFLIADMDQSKPWTLQDAEINYAVKLYSSVPPVIGHNFLAAAICAETIIGKFKAIPQDKKVGDLSLSFSGQFQFYSDLAYKLRQRANLDMVKPFVGGSSIAEKTAADADPDRVQPAAKIDGMNYASPANTLTGDNPGGGP